MSRYVYYIVVIPVVYILRSICRVWDRNRQLTGPCGQAVTGAKYWSAKYDSSSRDHRPSRDGKVELELLVCCPYGQYELELDVTSYCDKDEKQKRIAWRIENGYDGVSGVENACRFPRRIKRNSLDSSTTRGRAT